MNPKLTYIFLIVNQQQHGSVLVVVEGQLHHLIEIVSQLNVPDNLTSVRVHMAQETT